jgi:molybdopterin converting factor subunit 1
MIVKVKLFAVAKELAARDELAVELPPGATIAELRQRVAADYPALCKILSHAMWAVDAEYAEDSKPLNEQSNIALIPPVSGG